MIKNITRNLALMGILLSVAGSLYLSAQSCTACLSCGNCCYVSAPPNGSALCYASSTGVWCDGYDANGNLVESHFKSEDLCSEPDPHPTFEDPPM